MASRAIARDRRADVVVQQTRALTFGSVAQTPVRRGSACRHRDKVVNSVDRNEVKDVQAGERDGDMARFNAPP